MVLLSFGKSRLAWVDFAAVDACVDCLYAGLISSSDASSSEIVDVFFFSDRVDSFWKLTAVWLSLEGTC